MEYFDCSYPLYFTVPIALVSLIIACLMIAYGFSSFLYLLIIALIATYFYANHLIDIFDVNK